MIRWETGRRIREIRRDRGITQSTLAGTLGISPNLLGTWERGDQPPSPAALDALIDALDVDPVEAEVWVASVVPTEIEIVADPWLDVVIPAAPPAAATPPRPVPARPMTPARPSQPLPPPLPSPPTVSAAPPPDPFNAMPPKGTGHGNGTGNGNGNGHGTGDGSGEQTLGGLLDRQALTGKRRSEEERPALTDFLRSGALSDAFDGLLKKDKGPKKQVEDLPKPPSSRPVTPPLVRPANPLPSSPGSNGNGRAPAPPGGNGRMPAPPSSGPMPPSNGAMPPFNGNGNGLAKPPGSVTTAVPVVRPEQRTRASAVVAEQERRQRLARKKAAEDRALKRFVRKHGMTPAVYEQMKTSVNVGSAFPVPSTGSNPGAIRYSEEPLDSAKKDAWVYPARRIATAIALAVLVLVFFWAIAELAKGWSAFMELWSPGEEEPSITGALGLVGTWFG